jgi:hypothetical protein
MLVSKAARLILQERKSSESNVSYLLSLQLLHRRNDVQRTLVFRKSPRRVKPVWTLAQPETWRHSTPSPWSPDSLCCNFNEVFSNMCLFFLVWSVWMGQERSASRLAYVRHTSYLSCGLDYANYWMSGWLTEWLIDRMTHWLSDRLTLLCSLTVWIIEWPTDWQPDWLTGWLMLTDCDSVWLTGWPTEWLTHCKWQCLVD